MVRPYALPDIVADPSDAKGPSTARPIAHIGATTHYCSAISTGRSPQPWSIDCNALPTTAPNALCTSVAFMACPNVGDVVNKSPIEIGPYRASTRQDTFPTSAIVARLPDE